MKLENWHGIKFGQFGRFYAVRVGNMVQIGDAERRGDRIENGHYAAKLVFYMRYSEELDVFSMLFRFADAYRLDHAQLLPIQSPEKIDGIDNLPRWFDHSQLEESSR